MTLLLSGPYKRINSNDYLRHLADAYMKREVQVIFEEQNFAYSNFIPDVVHIQWPEAIYKWRKIFPMDDAGIKMFEKRLMFFKDNGTTIIYTAHNLLPHETTGSIDRKIYDLILFNADIIVHHGNASIALVKKMYSQSINARHVVAPHGPYDVCVLPDKSQSRKNYDLREDATIITNFGMQRSYKGMEFIDHVFTRWQRQGVCLFNIGDLVGDAKPLKTSGTYCQKQMYKRVPEDEVVNVIAATDMFFLGHSSGLNSGLIALALTYAKPLVFPDIGNFAEQVKGWEWFECYEAGNVASAIEALQRLNTRLSHQTAMLSNDSWLKINSWDVHVTQILDAIEK